LKSSNKGINMKYIEKSIFGLLAFGLMFLTTGSLNLPDVFINDAEARVGRPLTPVSVGGVARRTTRRSVYTAAAVTTTAVVVSQPTTVVTQPVTVVQQTAPLPMGSTVTSLPSGCDSKTVNSVSYFSCGGNWYKPAMQDGNVVYMVIANPS
jgi:hypothetical protein